MTGFMYKKNKNGIRKSYFVLGPCKDTNQLIYIADSQNFDGTVASWMNFWGLVLQGQTNHKHLYLGLSTSISDVFIPSVAGKFAQWAGRYN